MTSPWASPEPDPATRRLLRARPADVGPQPTLLRDPARALVVAGAVVAIATSPLPWLVRVGNPPAETMTGWSGLADGFFLSVAAAVLVVRALSRAAAESRSVLVRWLPLLLGAVAATFAVSALRNVDNRIRIWEHEGATGVVQPWLVAWLASIAVLALGAAWLGIRELRDPTAPRPSLHPSRPTVAWALLGGAGAIAGAGGIAAAILNSGLDPVAMSLPLLVGVMIGAILGGSAGAWLARTLTAPPLPPRDSTLDRVVPEVHARGDGPRSPDRGAG